MTDRDNNISGLGTRQSLIHAVADAPSRDLSADESVLITHAGAGALIADVLSASNLPEARAIALLMGLRLRGIIQPGARKGGSVFDSKSMLGAAARSRITRPLVTGTPAAPAAPAGPAPLDEKALAETVDLSDEQKRELLAMEGRTASKDLFAVLGIAPSADAATTKKAYYELTKRYHPDRYFGKNLGSFKARIDRIFKRITEAQQILTDAAKRSAFLAANPGLVQAPPAAAPLSPEDEARAAERRGRMAKHPYLARKAKLNELLARGRESMEKKDFSRAYNDLNLASQIDPGNKEITALLELAKKGGDQVRAAAEFAEGQRAELMGDAASSMQRYRSAASLDPASAQFAHKLATMLVATGTEAAFREANLLARRATESEPKNVDYHLTYASLLISMGLEKNARREYETVLKLKPDNEEAKAQLKKLKWKLG